jgi:hypothetical protein
MIVPPYWASFGDSYHYHSGSGNPSTYLVNIEDRNVGYVLTRNGNKILDPGDSAGQVSVVYSGMQFLFQMPGSGRLSVVSRLRAAEDLFYWGGLTNEVGGSNSAVTQGANFNMWLPPSVEEDGIAHNMVYYTAGGSDLDVWQYTFAALGELREFTFVSQARFEEGDWVLLNASIDTIQDVWVNDMDFNGYIENSWYITQLDVTAVP